MTITTLYISTLIVLSAYVLFTIKRETRYDKGLYPLCETRREMYRYLNNNIDSISIKEYKILKMNMKYIDCIIHEYKDLSKEDFRLRKLAGILGEILEFKKNKIDSKKKYYSENEELDNLFQKFNTQFLLCFFVNTPFLPLQRILFKLTIASIFLKQIILKPKGRENNNEEKDPTRIWGKYIQEAYACREQFKKKDLCHIA